MKQTEITKIKKEYYIDTLQKKLIKEMYFEEYELYREFAILNNKSKNDIEYKKIAFRCITFGNPYFMKKTIFHKFNGNFYTNNASIYLSVARVKRLPLFPFQDRKTYTSSFFKYKYESYIKHYDLFLDFDLTDDNFDKFISEVEIIIDLIIKFKLDSEVVFSGSRGFKILIYNDYYKHRTITKLIQEIKAKFNFDYLDMKGSFVYTKLMKCNFSLVFRDNCKIVLPLKEHSFNHILEDIKMNKNFNFFEYKNMKNYFDDKLFYIEGYHSKFLTKTIGYKKNFKDFVKYIKEK